MSLPDAPRGLSGFLEIPLVAEIGAFGFDGELYAVA